MFSLQAINTGRYRLYPAGLLLAAGLFMACAAPPFGPSRPSRPEPVRQETPLVGFTIQAGAFADINNASLFTASLEQKGIDATFFRDADGLYKVRFGAFSSKQLAVRKAEKLKQAGLIDSFYIVSPDQHAISARQERGEGYVRGKIVETARSFLGTPYLWGGTSAKTGFDCSGLTMTTYRLNGLVLPRTAREQYRTGNSVTLSLLEKGDLIFFEIEKKGGASHVGLFVGDGKFIHAPGRGKTIRIDKLSNRFFRTRFIGARSYL